MNNQRASFVKLTGSMAIFGTIGLFVRYIPLQSSMIALARGIIGTLFLLLVMLGQKKSVSKAAVRNNLLWLCLSGGCLGFNWILLFESYRYTSVAVSTLCYYMAPIIVVLVSPFVLKESLTPKKLLCVVAALCGMVCISGVLQAGIPSGGELKGILLGLSAAVLYAAIVLVNKQIRNISAYDKTVLQLGISAIVLLPYCIITYQSSAAAMEPMAVIMLLVVGIVHTGVTYYLYFGSMDYLSGQSVAVLSYIDPVVAVVISATILKETMDLVTFLGALLILGAALISELPSKEKRQTHD